MRHTPDSVKATVIENLERLFAPWAIGRPANWQPDDTTKHTVALGYWLDEELAKFCTPEDRKTQTWKFNRMSRTYDIWETACECLNEAIDGNVEQNRKAHRRWG